MLTSVQKMEESLRRLKKAKEKGRGAAANANAPLGNAPLSDDDKIRLQLCLDVNAFAQTVCSHQFVIFFMILFMSMATFAFFFSESYRWNPLEYRLQT